MEDRGDCLLCSHFVVSDCLWMVFGGVFTHKPGGQDAACKVLQITDVHILNNAKKIKRPFARSPR